jgi:UDP-2,4-diacetamido-2,4,6-trideoxy-beta-L-altropyranose hydrolase
VNVLFRTDASEAVGTGHFMRCMTLGSALRKGGAAVTFACRPLAAPLERAARERGFDLVGVDTRHAEQQSDADATLAAVGGRSFDWMVVDHYGLDAAWELRMRKAIRLSLVIDDLADRRHACDVLLDQNLRRDGGSGYNRQLPAGCERLLGPRYALLDPSFKAQRDLLAGAERRAILISFGGSDPHSLTLPVLRALLQDTRREAPIDVVVGALHRDTLAIEAAAADAAGVTLHKATREMARLMARAKIYIGAGGSTSWERCCLALPGVVVAVADNQAEPCAALEAAGSHVYLGKAEDIPPAAIAQAAFTLLGSPATQQSLAARSAAIVDGRGAERVAARLSGGEVRLRPATQADAGPLLAWRNHPDIRRYSGNAAEIRPAEHAAWFERVLADRARHLLIAEDAAGPLGVLRYDVDEPSARVSIYLAPERLGSGGGSRLLAAGERWIAARRPHLRELTAEVRDGNEASRRLFFDAGYRLRGSLYRRYLATEAHP